MRPIQLCCSLIVVLFVLIAKLANAADLKEKLATRPYLTFFVSSIDQVQQACRTVFESVDRPDLAASIKDRLKDYQGFAGIDPTKPGGRMTVWGEASEAEIVFLPVGEIEQLVKTATFDVVGFHRAGPDHFEIERPGSPYHVLVRGDYAFLADSTATMRALQVTPEQLTRGYRDRYDLGLIYDLKQIPAPVRAQYTAALRQQVEPWLQSQDDEEIESAKLRRTLGQLALQLVERFLLDTNSVVIGAHLDPQSRKFRFEIVVDVAQNSPSAVEINRWKTVRSEFAAMMSSDVPFGLALNLPLGGLAQTILGKPQDGKPNRSERLEAGLQLVGEELGRLTIIAALRGNDAVQINDAIPDLLLRLENSGKFASVTENFDLQRGVVFHSMVPHQSPSWLSGLIGQDVEILLGQGKQIVWMGIGPSEKLTDQMYEAIDRVANSSPDASTVPLARASFQAKKLPELALSGLLVPNVDKEVSRKAFAEGEDQFSVSLEPLEHGIRLRIDAEEGFVRLMGKDWVKQVEASNAR